MIDETTNTVLVPVPTHEPPIGKGYVIRIHEPADVVSFAETRVFAHPDETDEPIRGIMEKLTRNGIREWVIHVVDISTDDVVYTSQRRMAPKVRTEEL